MTYVIYTVHTYSLCSLMQLNNDGIRTCNTIVNFNESVTAILLQDNIWPGNTVRCVVISMGRDRTRDQRPLQSLHRGDSLTSLDVVLQQNYGDRLVEIDYSTLYEVVCSLYLDLSY